MSILQLINSIHNNKDELFFIKKKTFLTLECFFVNLQESLFFFVVVESLYTDVLFSRKIKVEQQNLNEYFFLSLKF